MMVVKVRAHGDDQASENDVMPPLASVSSGAHLNDNTLDSCDAAEGCEENEVPPLDSFGRGCHLNKSVPHSNGVGGVCEHDDASPLISSNRWD